VRAAILALLAERSMHGYEMIQEIGERSGGLWRRAPARSTRPCQLLADEGLVTSSEGSGSKRLFELTDEGRPPPSGLDSTPPWEHFAQDVDPDDVTCGRPTGLLMGAMFQVSNAATPAQKARAIDVINEARRELYAILRARSSRRPRSPGELTSGPVEQLGEEVTDLRVGTSSRCSDTVISTLQAPRRR